MPLTLDHVFAFVDPALSEVALLERAGFVVAPRHEHAGQGTANRSVMFPANYLELLFLASRAEAERNVLRLDRRADFRTTGECPFGIGLRGALTEAERASFWPYRPPYATPGWPPIWIHRRTTESAGLPLVFAMEPWARYPDADAMRPDRRMDVAARGLLAHRTPARGVRSVTIHVPDGRGWPLSIEVPDVRVEAGGPYRMAITLDSGEFPTLPLSSHLDLHGPERAAGRA